MAFQLFQRKDFKLQSQLNVFSRTNVISSVAAMDLKSSERRTKFITNKNLWYFLLTQKDAHKDT